MTRNQQLTLYLQLLLLFYNCSCTSAVVKIVFVGGQSNCQGLADASHLEELIKDGLLFDRYANAATADQEETTRGDVYVVYEPERGGVSGPLSATFGDTNTKFGIEMGMGYVLGDYYEDDDNDPVLIVKHCEVSPLATEWLPPSSSSTSSDGGGAYNRAIETYRYVVEHLGEYIPNYDDNGALGYEIISFVWIHGYADAYVPEYIHEYENNLFNLILDINTEFPAIQSNIIVQTGGGGAFPDGAETLLRNIQACVALEIHRQQQQQLLDIDAAFVETYQFSTGEPRNNETFEHYFGRADNYINIGESIANAILQVIDGTYSASTATCSSMSSSSPSPTSQTTSVTFDPTTYVTFDQTTSQSTSQILGMTNEMSVQLTIDIMYDNSPQETGWTLSNLDTNEIMYESSPGTVTESGLTSITIDVPHGTYLFDITDEGGDGICCNNGKGYVEIYQIIADSGGRLYIGYSGGKFNGQGSITIFTWDFTWP